MLNSSLKYRIYRRLESINDNILSNVGVRTALGVMGAVAANVVANYAGFDRDAMLMATMVGGLSGFYLSRPLITHGGSWAKRKAREVEHEMLYERKIKY